MATSPAPYVLDLIVEVKRLQEVETLLRNALDAAKEYIRCDHFTSVSRRRECWQQYQKAYKRLGT